MIYTGAVKQLFFGERIRHPPVEMWPVEAEHLLDASRINYAKKHTIEHNFRVKFIGEISPQTSDAFWNTYNFVNRTWEAPRASGSRRQNSSHTSHVSKVDASTSKDKRK